MQTCLIVSKSEKAKGQLALECHTRGGAMRTQRSSRLPVSSSIIDHRCTRLLILEILSMKIRRARRRRSAKHHG